MGLGYKFESLTLACSHQAVRIGTDLTSQGLRTLAGDVEGPGLPRSSHYVPQGSPETCIWKAFSVAPRNTFRNCHTTSRCAPGAFGKAGVTSAGSPHFEDGRLQLCRWALYKQRCWHRFCPSSHVRYCHLVTFRNLVVLKALIWNKGLCQHFCAEFLFSMIYNEAYF